MKRNFKVEKSGIRLDKFLSEAMEGCSRQLARKACGSRRVLLNGRAASKPGMLLSEGDQIEVDDDFLFTNASSRHWQNQDPLKILQEDSSLVAVHKPAGMHSIRLRAEDPPTVADFLSSAFPQTASASPDPRESGLVQRLDFWTTGVLVAAKTEEMHRALLEQMKTGTMVKTYLALVEGELRNQKVSRCFLETKPGSKRVHCMAEHPGHEHCWPVELSIEPVDGGSLSGMTVVRVSLHSAKRHQVRAQLAYEGLTLVGDEQYGSSKLLRELDIEQDGFMLFAESVSFAHPLEGAQVFIKASDERFETLCGKRD